MLAALPLIGGFSRPRIRRLVVLYSHPSKLSEFRQVYIGSHLAATVLLLPQSFRAPAVAKAHGDGRLCGEAWGRGPPPSPGSARPPRAFPREQRPDLGRRSRVVGIRSAAAELWGALNFGRSRTACSG